MTETQERRTIKEIIELAIKHSRGPSFELQALDVIHALHGARYRIVPEEPTEKMKEAGYQCCSYCEECKDSTTSPTRAYEAMITASEMEIK